MIIKLFLFFILGFILSKIFTPKTKNHEGKIFPNMIIVKNTTTCENECYHIHHYIFLFILLVLYFLLNYILGFNFSTNYYYLISMYVGVFVSEYYTFGNNIFIINQKCFPNCNIIKN